MSTVFDRFAKSLKALGIQYVYGIPGGYFVEYIEALKNVGIDFILVSNEASAGFMAETHWRLTGKIAACYGTLGPGATNLSTGVGCGYLDRVPMLVFTHEVQSNMIGKRTQMGVDHQALFKPITKWTTRLHSSNMEKTIQRAYEVAVSEVPGPVHIGIPADLAENKKSFDVEEYNEPEVLKCSCNTSFDEFEALFTKAKKPIIAIGLGAVRWGLKDLILKILKKHKMPVVITPMAKGIISETHPCYAGVLFHASRDFVAVTHKEADLVIGIGYDPVEFDYEDWISDIPLVHIDTVPVDLNRKTPKKLLNMICDVDKILSKFLKLDKCKNEWDFKLLADRQKKLLKSLRPDSKRFGPRSLLSSLRVLMPINGILTCDVGAHTHLIGQQWITPEPQHLILTNGWSSMGFGIPAAIAAKQCKPDQQVACITGDGGFLMMVGEMATAKRLGLSIVFIVLVDKNLSLIRLKQDKKKLAPIGTTLLGENYTSPESYFGVPVIEVHNIKEFQKILLSNFFKENKLVIIEAFIDPSEYNDLILKDY